MPSLTPKSIALRDLPSLFADALRLIQRGLWTAMAIPACTYGVLHLASHAHVFLLDALSLFLILFVQSTLLPALMIPVFLRAEGALPPPTTTRWLQSYRCALRAFFSGIVLRVLLPLGLGGLFVWLLVVTPPPEQISYHEHARMALDALFGFSALVLFVSGSTGLMASLLMLYKLDDRHAAQLADLRVDLCNLPLLLTWIALAWIAAIAQLMIAANGGPIALYIVSGFCQCLYSALIVVVYLRVFEDRGLHKKQSQTLFFWRRASA